MHEAPHLLVTGELKHSVEALRKESVAHLTYPVSRNYNLQVRYQGRLRDEDTELLVALFDGRGRLKAPEVSKTAGDGPGGKIIALNQPLTWT